MLFKSYDIFCPYCDVPGELYAESINNFVCCPECGLYFEVKIFNLATVLINGFPFVEGQNIDEVYKRMKRNWRNMCVKRGIGDRQILENFKPVNFRKPFSSDVKLGYEKFLSTPTPETAPF